AGGIGSPGARVAWSTGRVAWSGGGIEKAGRAAGRPIGGSTRPGGAAGPRAGGPIAGYRDIDAKRQLAGDRAVAARSGRLVLVTPLSKRWRRSGLVRVTLGSR